MTKINPGKNDFFIKNEKEQNLVVMRMFFYAPLSGIIMLICMLTGIIPETVYPSLNVKPFLFLIFYQVAQAILMKFFCFRKPEHPAIKYFVIISTELYLFMLTITEGFEPFIIYALVPLLSCLYFNREFCLTSSFFSYFAMILSIVIRAQADEPLSEGLSSFQWGIEYGEVLTIEFILNVGILFLISQRHLEVIGTNLNAIEKLQNTQDELISSYSELVCQTYQIRKFNIKRCQAIVACLCDKLMEHKDFSELENEEVVKDIISSVPLHDIGLIGVPDAVISKCTSRTEEEKAEYEKHVHYGEELIRKNFCLSDNRDFLMIARMAALHHHEHWDGSGYPDHQRGPAIPVCARIIAAADILEQSFTGDNEHDVVSFGEALSHIQRISGTILDPVVADALLASASSLEKLYS